MSVREDHSQRIEWQLDLGRLHQFPLRCWIAVASMNPRIWALIIGLPPLVALVAYPLIGVPAIYTLLFLSFIYFLMVWFTSQRDIATRYTLDHARRRIAIETPNIDFKGDPLTAAVAPDDPGVELSKVERLTASPIPGHVIVDATYRGTNVTDPDSFVVPRAEYDRVRTGLSEHDFDLPPRSGLSGSEFRTTRWVRHAMVLATAAIICGGPLVVPIFSRINPALYGGAAIMVCVLSAEFLAERAGVIPKGTGPNALLKRSVLRLLVGALVIVAAFAMLLLAGRLLP
jgi:hypothetical protein